MLVCVLSVALAACGASSSTPALVPSSKPSASTTVAACEHPPAPLLLMWPAADDCKEPTLACRQQCAAHQAEACYQLARHAEQAKQLTTARAFYHQACMGGHASGCTNYAAYAYRFGNVIAAPCIRPFFVAACDAADSYGCGMTTVVDLRNAKDAAARQALAPTAREQCARIGGFTCDILYNMLSEAIMPPLDGNEAAAARRRACETGAPQACDAATP